ncbi:hypothetical protein JHK87_023505 [Glycine soja]|nr:hypothetical protein JHK87_023505 [Glycine soja]
MQCIGATTLDEYRKHIEKDPALERQPDETTQILKGLRERYEIHHKLRYTDVQLSHLNVLLPLLFILPILFIYAGDQTSSRVRLQQAQVFVYLSLNQPDLLSINGLILLDLHASSYRPLLPPLILVLLVTVIALFNPFLLSPKEVSTPVPKFTRELSTQSSDFNILSS